MNNIDQTIVSNQWEEKVIYKTNVLYALTINPSDRYQYIDKKKWADRYKSCHDYIVRLFSDASLNQTYYHLWEELSEVTNSKLSRYHLHGVICFETQDALRYWLLEMTIFLMPTQWELKPIDDLCKWESYCQKQGLLKYVTNIFDYESYKKEITPNGDVTPTPTAPTPAEKKRRRARKSSRKP